METAKPKGDFKNWKEVRMAGYQVRERIFALFVLGSIAIVAMIKLTDPENIIINIIVAIGAYTAGRSDKGEGQRVTDKSKEVKP